MNPLTNVKNLQKLNERELELGIIGKKSWHDEYKDSAWLFIGGLPYDLSEGDVLCVFSQYGEIVNLNLVRDNKTGKSKGFAFLCYEDQRSTVLAVDNLNSIKILGRVIRVDHVKDYKIPKEYGNEDELTMKIRQEGCQPKLATSSEEEEEEAEANKKPKKDKKKKKEKKKKKKKKREKSSSNENSDSETDDRKPNIAVKVEVKQEKSDPGYDKALASSSSSRSNLRKEIKKDPEEREGRNSDFRSRDDNRNQRNERGRELYSNYDRERKRSDRFETERSAANGFNARGNFDDSFDRDRDRSRDRNREKERNDRYRDRESIRHREKEDRSRDRHSESDRRDTERRSERDYDRGEDKYRQRDRHR